MQSLNTRQLAGALLVALCLFAPGLSMAQEQQYGSDYIIVAPGMTLTGIMREYYPQYRNHWPALMDEVIRINPHAFVNDAPASLKRGMRLTLPKEVPATRTASTGTVAPPTQTTTQAVEPVGAVSATAAVSSTSQSTGTTAATGSAAQTTTSSAAQSSTSPQTAATTPQQPAIQGTSQVTAPEPVAALPPPMESETDDSGDQGAVGAGEVVAQEAQESSFKERPPWWWIISAVVMLALVL